MGEHLWTILVFWTIILVFQVATGQNNAFRVRGKVLNIPCEEQRETVRDQLVGEFIDLLETLPRPSILDDVISRRPRCGDPGWTRVAFLNMTDPSGQCPSPLRLYTTPTRACGRAASGSGSCSSVMYSTGSQSYRLVCGRIIGYQFATPDALFRFNTVDPPPTIDEPYADGVSVTHGQPRNHIWTFVASNAENNSTPMLYECPCDNSKENGTAVPPFIEDNYFCEAGTINHEPSILFYEDDPLWDGQGCGPTSQCCTFNSPPWFTVLLPSSTTDDIEVRICGDESTSDEDSPIELLELYVY